MYEYGFEFIFGCLMLKRPINARKRMSRIKVKFSVDSLHKYIYSRAHTHIKCIVIVCACLWFGWHAMHKYITLRVHIRYIAVIRALAWFGHWVHMRNENKLHHCIASHVFRLIYFHSEYSSFRNKMSTKTFRF